MVIRPYTNHEPRFILGYDGKEYPRPTFRWRLSLELAKHIDGRGNDRRFGRGDYPFIWLLSLHIGFKVWGVSILPFVNRRKYYDSIRGRAA